MSLTGVAFWHEAPITRTGKEGGTWREQTRSQMDDNLMLYKEDGNFDSTTFMYDLERSECYWKPLALEDGKDGVLSAPRDLPSHTLTRITIAHTGYRITTIAAN